MSSIDSILSTLDQRPFSLRPSWKSKNYAINILPLRDNNAFRAVSSIKDKGVVKLISPNIGEGPWIAGGAVIKWYKNESLGESDIDVFCKSGEQYRELIDRIASLSISCKIYESESAVTFKLLSTVSHVIQVIKRVYPSWEELLCHFDFTACKIVTDGKEFYTPPNSSVIDDINSKVLRIDGKLQPTAMKRLIKYLSYGYCPAPGLIDTIANAEGVILDFSNTGMQTDYDCLIVGGNPIV